MVARRAHNPEVGGSSPPSATIRKALESQDFKASFFLNHHWDLNGSSRKYSVLVSSFWAANRAARQKLSSNPVGSRSAERRRDDEGQKKMGIPIAVPLGVGKAMGIFATPRAKTRKLKTGDTEPNSRIPEDFSSTSYSATALTDSLANLCPMVSGPSSLALELWMGVCFALAAHLPPKNGQEKSAADATPSL